MARFTFIATTLYAALAGLAAGYPPTLELATVAARELASEIPLVHYHNVVADGCNIFYREAGEKHKPTILLLHGFPTSSHEYRNLMPLLATNYHVLAPDFPAFGFTVARADYNYTFSSLTITTQAFLTALDVTNYALYLMDYGGAVGIRLAIANPTSVKALISQNGNIYPQGFDTAFWDPVKAYWASNSTADREALAGALSLASIQEQYLSGVPDPEKVAPETYWLDTALAARPGIGDIQLDLLFNVQFNLQELPLAQAYFHKHEPPLLVAWGTNDPVFNVSGALAFKADLPKAETHFFPGGHFAVESSARIIADLMLEFLPRQGFS